MSTITALTEAVLLTPDPDSFVTARTDRIKVELGGIPGDRHYGLLRRADSRQNIYPRGMMIANRRQISIISLEECAIVAERLNIPELLPEWLGANVLVSCYPNLTLLPKGARLLFASGAGLISEGENDPCIYPGQKIAEAYGERRLKSRFVKEAMHLRGIVCSVEREGSISVNDHVSIILPK